MQPSDTDKQLTPEADWRRSGVFLDWIHKIADLRFWQLAYIPVIIVVLLSLIPLNLLLTTPLSLTGQTLFGFGCFVLALWLRRYEGHIITMTLIIISLITSIRYIYWRVTETMPYGLDTSTIVDLTAGTLLLVAELYALIVLIFGFFQVVWPLHRKPAPLPVDTSEWPSVDVFIPTYNEPMSVVRPTVLAAQELDWPADKLNIYVLDDGCRDEFAVFCEEVGVTHLPRKESTHAKAGNINKALTKTNGDLITIFDCDHIPTRSFLQLAVGWFVKDPLMALVQLPHHFFSPDPFERNLGTFKTVPNEGELFYGLLQDGNDFWNATFFCGSCAVLRRTALLEVGGVAVETVTEDAHTALKMHRLGWRSAYINVAQAAGLATESLSAHVGQRIRWARGMAQIFRVDNPFLTRGLKLGQRLCYANAMMHFFYGIPRLIFLLAPLSFLFFEAHIISASALMIAAYAIPHLLVANLTNSRLQGPFRHSFWAEVYETVLAYYIMVPTLLAIINPKLGSFNVTEKGGIVDESYFDGNIAKPYIVIFLLNIVGMFFGVARLLYFNTHEIDTVLLNMFWTTYNIVIIGAALSVAWEAQQIRSAVRVETDLDARVRTPDGRIITGKTLDLSEGGAAVQLDESSGLGVGEEIEVEMSVSGRAEWMPATTTRAVDELCCFHFNELNLVQERHLIFCIFGRADAWVSWAQNRDVDHPGRAFIEVLSYGYLGSYRIVSMYLQKARKRIVRLFTGNKSQPSSDSGASTAASWVPALIPTLALAGAAAVATLASTDAAAQLGGFGEDRVAAELRAETLGDDERVLTLEDLGNYQQAIRLRGVQGELALPLSVRDDEVIQSARMVLNFAHSPALLFNLSHINVMVNQELVTTIPLSSATASGATRSFNIDPRLFLQYNQILLQFIGHYTEDCEDPTHTSLWATISKTSRLELTVKPLELENELNQLPQPFFDRRDQRRLELPFVFAGEPTLAEVEAAGLVASWFGSHASYRGAEFPVYINEFPDGHAVVIARGNAGPAGLSVPGNGNSRVSMLSHPTDTASKLLVFSGSSNAGLITAAKTFALGPDALSGQTAQIDSLVEPEPREAYDAPRWLNTDRPVAFHEIVSQASELEIRGLYPDVIRVNYAIPPDLFSWESDGVPLDIKYRHTPSIGPKSTLNVNVNNEFVSAIPISSGSISETGVRSRVQIPFLNSYDSVNEESVRVPLFKMSGQNQLQFHYYFDRNQAENNCVASVVDNLRGSIDEDSTIDFSKFPHYTKLPELSLFANGMFPFTKYADLSDTAIVLPTQLNATEVSAYLTVMGQIGNVTGYPGIRATLVQGSDTSALEGKHVLVLGSAENQPLLTTWADSMPLRVSNGRATLKVYGPVERALSRWRGRDLAPALEHAGEVVLQAGAELGAIMSFESPISSNHSVVVMTGGDSQRFSDVAHLMLDGGDRQFIRGDLVLLNGDEINHYRLGGQYTMGKLPFITWLRYSASKQPVWLLVVIVLVALLIAFVLYNLLRRMALSRLRGER